MTNFYLVDIKDFSSSALYARALTLVSAERLAKVHSFVQPRDKQLSLAAYLLLLYALAQAGLNEKELRSLRFTYGAYGKPSLADYPHLHFNLSHASEKALVVISNKPVGCDIECLPPTFHLTDLLGVWHPLEQKYLASLPANARENMALRLWVAKESYVKALGLGIAKLPPASYAIELTATTARIAVALPGAPQVRVRLLPCPYATYALASSEVLT